MAFSESQHLTVELPMGGALQLDRNALLKALPRPTRQRIEPLLSEVFLPLGEVICKSGRKILHVYFPVDCIVSLLSLTEDGHSTELCMVGREGMVGYSAFMGGESTPSVAVIQSAGTALRLPAAALACEFNNEPAVRVLFLRYMQAVVAEISQTALCNCHHTIRQRFCRWLLMSLDRVPGENLHMTQELIANMLGVRREGVTRIAKQLRKAGVLEYRRGYITVLDRARLQKMSCECYEVLKAETERLNGRDKHP